MPSLLEERKAYKPFDYPWAYEAWQQQQRMHWLPEEVPLDVDVRDWKHKLTESEKNLLTQIFRFFTQADIDVNGVYMEQYSQVFKPIEVKMLLSVISNVETIHVAAYSHLLDTIGMPEATYAEFMDYKEMRDKHNYYGTFNVDDSQNVALTMAAFGAFTEGMQLFASFAMLMNFQRFGKMRGMGQIIAWSVRDETLHCVSIIRLFHEFVKERSHEIDLVKLKKDIKTVCLEMVKHEDAFIDLAFGMGPLEDLTADDLKKYIRYISDRRMNQLGYKSIFNVGENPLPWMDEILNGLEHANFFENRSTEYTRAATQGTWDEAWDSFKDKAIAI